MSSPGLTRTANNSINSRTLCQLSYGGSATPILGHQFGDRRLPARFWAKVNEQGPWPLVYGAPGQCWLWTAAVSSRGYGCIGFGPDTRTTSTHRLAYEALVGPIPEGLTIDHLCRVKRCVNPTHFEVVTAVENRQRITRAQTHCVKLHPLFGDNLRIHGTRKTRVCIACQREANRLYRLRVKAS
jgi:hypothetical protein